MWKLIATIIFSVYLNIVPNNYTILIIDDCTGWEKMTNGLKYTENFILTRGIPKEESVSLGHVWFDPEQKLLTKTLSFIEINEANPLYVSELDFEDWTAFNNSKEKGKIFVLLPEDYCSNKRFINNQKFTLYEITLVLAEKL
jgi:hypothetical protein